MMFSQVDPRATRSVMNNQIAMAEQAAGGRSVAGGGLSRGAGQAYADSYRAGVGRAQGRGAAQGTRQEDLADNRRLAFDASMMLKSRQSQYDALDEQLRQSQWDSRFNNLTTAWGALAGLLR